MALCNMASHYIFLVVLVSSSVHGMDWSQLFTNWMPFRPHTCPAMDLGSNEQYTLVQTNGTKCSSSLQNRCSLYRHNVKHKRSRFFMSTTYKGPCSSVNATTCTNFECKRSCVAGYHRTSDGKCVNTVTLHCFNGGSPNYNLTKCVCSANFTGDQCDIPICSPGCRNGGVCSLPPDSRCFCPNYLTGTTCETPVCGSGCRNGGECVFTGTTSECLCRSGYIGSKCQFKTTESLPVPVCDASDNIDNATSCIFNEQCDEGAHCCIMSPGNIFGYCSMPSNNVTCIHQDGAEVAVNEIYNSVRNCEACVCKSPTNTSAEHGDIDCISAGCSSDFLSNPYCCPNTTDNKPCPPPVISGCPRKGEIINVDTSPYQNSALLINTFEAHDCLGNSLPVDLNQVFFSACECDSLNIHSVRATSQQDFNGRQGTCDFRVVVRDMASPVFITCPATMYVRQGETVSWAKPEVVDNVGIRQIYLDNSRIKNNSMVINQGIHFLHYTAIDWQGNKAYCRFRIHVYKADTDESNYPPQLRERKKHVSPVIIGMYNVNKR
ncbi:Prolow-density lipoprotein receptor-related protein 1 [Mizuhopecten yessoensis]|uniref:Prolow-density lipoprotein receptor-related protein 1 n=1 Tax=Mizuhopecten yessoensis TaxID=6573 RepID=A0A210PR14_MIZYE|nr:Prolow-density lipoprotein receptor-related protein 1 [Mizuhopecten yessoensis]